MTESVTLKQLRLHKPFGPPPLRRIGKRYWWRCSLLREWGMKLRHFLLAAGLLALPAACATAPASDATLQQTASLMVSITQHGEGMGIDDINDLSAQLDEQVASAPNDPYVLKLAAQARRTLSDYSQDRAQRVHLRHTALADLDKAISLSKPTHPPRTVTLNGEVSDVDFKDLATLRADLFHQVQTDR